MSVTDEPNGFSDIDSQSLNHDQASISNSKSDVEIDKYGFTGGNQYTNPETEQISVVKIRKRESKWLQMLDNWDKWMAKKFPQVKKRCRKGIPSSLRGRAWQLLCGSKQLHSQNRDVFQSLLSAEAAPQVVEDIEKDLHRQFPFHEMFQQRGGSGQKDLHDILYAYANYNTRDGYCQAQAPVAAVLLMHMPLEEAFWCMVAMFDYYIPGYYSPGLEAVQVDGAVMQGLLKQVAPLAYKHLEKHHTSPMLYCTEWFMCIFSRTLPWPSVLRLWDMFFCEGVKVIFRCCLVLLRNTLGKAEVVKKLPGLYETLEYLKKFNMKDMQTEPLMSQIVTLKVNEVDLENEHKRQHKMRKKQNAQAKVVKRVYRYTPTHTHRRGTSAPSPSKSKKRLNAVSVNTPLMMEQAAEYERNEKNKKREQKVKKSPSSRSQKSTQSVQLTEYKRYTDESHSRLRTDGDINHIAASATPNHAVVNATSNHSPVSTVSTQQSQTKMKASVL